jgi:DNA-binding transcriptional LysR family regulator
MIDLDQLRIFQAVAQTRSFTRAAEIVHLTQPGISKHIRQMEEYYGVPLFDRLGRKVALTQAGEILFEATQEIMALAGAAEERIQELAGMRAGRLRLGASFPIGVYILPGVLAAFRKSYPDVELTLNISTSEEIEAEVLANKLDIGLVSGEVHDPRLLVKQFMTDELVVIAPHDHKWTAKGRVKAEELISETFIWAAPGAGIRAVVEERLKAKGLALHRVIDFVNLEGVKHAVEAGLGISIQPRMILQREMAAGSLKALRLADMDSEVAYLYVYRKKRHVSAAAKAFLELLLKTTATSG